MTTENLTNPTPLILVNFKNFPECNGDSAFQIAKKLQKSAYDTGLQIAVSVQSFFLSEMVKYTDLKIMSQHLDSKSEGSTTGSLLPEVLKAVGGWGSILNHSEKRIPLPEVEKIVDRMNQLGLVSIVCVENVDEVKKVSKFKPNFIAIEPPELIGGDISVSTAKPELITESVEAAGDTAVLVGAGIKNGDDLKIAMQLGAKGILVASGVCKAKDPYEVILDSAKSIN